MRNLMGSQCNCYSAEVICDCRSRLSSNPAAAFCTRCRGASEDAGRPENTEYTELQYNARWPVTWRAALRRLDWHSSVSEAAISDGRNMRWRPCWCVFAWIVCCPAEHRGHERHQRTEWLTNRQTVNERHPLGSLARLWSVPNQMNSVLDGLSCNRREAKKCASQGHRMRGGWPGMGQLILDSVRKLVCHMQTNDTEQCEYRKQVVSSIQW